MSSDVALALELSYLRAEIGYVMAAQLAPSVVYKPMLRKANIKGWEVVYGDFSAYGLTPAEAMSAFDRKWNDATQ